MGLGQLLGKLYCGYGANCGAAPGGPIGGGNITGGCPGWKAGGIGGIGGSGGKPPIGWAACCVSKPPGELPGFGGRMPRYCIADDMPCVNMEGPLGDEAASISSSLFLSWVASSLYL